MRLEGKWKDAVLAWSTVNLLFFRRWAQVLPGGHDYFLEGPRAPLVYLSLMLLVLVLSAGAWGLLLWARARPARWPLTTLRAGFLVLVAVALFGVLSEGWVFLGRPDFVLWVDLLPFVAAAAAIGYLQWRHNGWHRRVLPLAVSAMMLFSPLIPIMYAQGFYHSATADAAAGRFAPEYADLVDADPAHQRVVWVIFDELDQALTFEERPPGVSLPELDRLRNESLHATHAYAPNAATLRSIPSMTTGRLVEESLPHGVVDIKITFRDGGKTREWRDLDTVFHRAHAAGADVGAVGNYHPYCRLFEGALAACHFEGHYEERPDFASRVQSHLLGLTRSLPTSQVRSLFWDQTHFKEDVSVGRQEREIGTYNGLHTAAMEMVARPDLEFVFLHYNIPHPTGMRGAGRGFYDAATGELATGPRLSYFDNLALTDRALGELRGAMEAAGVWDNTTVIVTSDHGYRYGVWRQSESTRQYGDLLHRPTDHRVVFLYKPAAPEPTGLQYDEPFNLVLLPDLTLASLDGTVGDATEAAAWLEGNRTFGPAPYYKVR